MRRGETSHPRKLRPKKGRRVVVVDAFNVAKKRVQELKNQLAEAEQD